MKWLKISNKGLLDIRLFSLMGGTTKENDDAKIGQWGSGLKYAICFLLRNNIQFKIVIENQTIDITTQKEIIRDEEFNVVYVNNEKTSLTTKMGGNAWKHWQCLREIYSNALDEGNAQIEIVDEPIGTQSDRTYFFIYATPEILEVYNNWNNYFLVDKVPMYENETFKLYPNGGNLKLYKQGVLIGEKDYKSLFLYDFKNARINELREYQGSFNADISEILYFIDDVEVIKYIIKNITDEVYEGKHVDFKFWRSETWQKPNKAWAEAFGNAKIITQEIKDKCQGKQVNIDLDHTIVLPKNLYEGLNHHIKDISALRLANKINEFYEIYDQDLELKLKQSLVILEQADYWINPEAKFIFGEFGQGTTLAKVNLDTKEIMLSQKLKDKSLFDFCSTLVEENEHLRTGMSDETREFQQHFIDLYTKSILDKAEINI
jgi:hypothetical protein